MDKLELLSVSLLKDNPNLAKEFKDLSIDLGIGLGWHYLLDLSWAALQLNSKRGMKVMDAGAGMGMMQWWMAEHGVDVISVDREIRADLPMSFRQRYRIRGWRKKDLNPNLHDFLPSLYPLHWHLYPQKLIRSIRLLQCKQEIASDSGTVFIYNHDIKFMTDLPDESVDAIVSISALEHNPPNELKACIAELMRVLKSGGKLIVTMAAAKEQDWFHEPSKGWCYTETTLRDIFDLPSSCSSNFDKCDELLMTLRDCKELSNNLADFYFKSGENGMPWGIWNPEYQPVGIIKIKRRY